MVSRTLEIIQRAKAQWESLNEVSFEVLEGEKGSTRYAWGIRKGELKVTGVSITLPLDLPEEEMFNILVEEISRLLGKEQWVVREWLVVDAGAPGRTSRY